MSTIEKLAVNSATVVVSFGLVWRTMIGAAIGAVVGSGSTVGAIGGAVMGGFVGYETGK